MIIGVGLDIAQVERVERAWQRHGTRFFRALLYSGRDN
jgi:phosphopantetheinyl transferase (holo-ACP synthase)